MFKRVRRLEISLAAKCQLLFGAAVVLIIAAALAVPWQRFEELTGQLNDGPAEALNLNALAQHVAARKQGISATAPAARQPTRAVTRPTTDPAQAATTQPADESAGAVLP